jgi:hypothetical protein
MSPERVAELIREQRAKYERLAIAGANIQDVTAVTLIKVAYEDTRLTPAERLAEIGNVLAGLDLVAAEGSR